MHQGVFSGITQRMAHAFARLLVALCLLSTTAESFAFELAPVCDPSGASAIAPIPVVPIVDPATWDYAPCGDDSFDEGASEHRQLRQASAPLSSVAAFAPSHYLPSRRAPIAVPLPQADVNLSNGYTSSLYRPPR
ncbi:MAG: hypothetical protein HRU17_15365 [Polyangiaceae bacterium]|nr:hypothetical protein [Polyangiaceae bacterium]